MENNERPRPLSYIVTVPFWGVKMPPLGAAYVAAAAEEAGYPVKLVDLNVECFDHVRGDPAFEVMWQTNPPDMTAQEATNRVFDATRPVIDAFIDELLSSGAALLSLSLNYRNLDFGDRLVKRLREVAPDFMVLYGGPESFAQQKTQTFHLHGADVWVVGEGERVYVDVLAALWEGRTLEGIPGVVVKRGGVTYSPFTPRKPEMKLDRLPYPTYEGLPLHKYSTSKLPMLLSRGCVCHCRFCVDYILNAPYRFRSPEAVIEEMKFHLEKNGSGEFALNDLLCNGNMKQLEKICDTIVESELPVHWDSYAIVRKEMKPPILEKMRKAGCTNLCYGTESGNDRVLKLMGKFAGADIAKQNIRDTHEAGIRTSLNIIVGYPGEQEEEFTDTLAFLEELAPWIDEVTNVSSLVVMPGSFISEHVKEFGIPYLDVADSWVDELGSTPEKRGRRVERVLELINRKGLGKEIINHDYLTAKHIMITAVVPCDGSAPDRQLYREVTNYPFQLILAGDGLEDVPTQPRLQTIIRGPGETLASCVNKAVEQAAGRYVTLTPPGKPPNRSMLFNMFKSMENTPIAHFGFPRQPGSQGIFFRKVSWQEVGGLDESFGPEAWLQDLLMRAHLWGYASTSVLDSAVEGDHGEPAFAAPSPQAARNALELVLKNYPSILLKKDGFRVARRLLGRMRPSRSNPLSPLQHLAGYYHALIDFPRTLSERRRILCQMTIPDDEAGRFLEALEALEG